MSLSHREKLYGTIVAIILLIFLGMLAYIELEGWSWIESLYFSVATLTTVGYGDLHPTNDISRLFTTGYMIIGVTVMFASLGELGAYYLHERDQKIITRKTRRQKISQEK